MLFVSVFLLWHDPTMVGLSLRNNLLHVTSLWLLLAAALIYWRQIVGAGAPPGTGLGSTMSGWAAAAYLLAAEIPNMMAGVSIAFIATPLYRHYVDAQHQWPAAQTVQEDQMIAGGGLGHRQPGLRLQHRAGGQPHFTRRR
ncbi:MAG: cytochrome c oxidase assembly protein [Caldilineaceae bacterium]